MGFCGSFDILLVTVNVDELNRFETFIIVSDRDTTELHFRLQSAISPCLPSKKMVFEFVSP